MAKKTQSKYSNSQIRVLATHLVDYERAGNDEDARRTVVEAAVEMPPPPTPPTLVEVGPKRPSPGPSDDGGQPAKRQKRRGQGEESGTTKPPSPPTQVPSRSARPQRIRKLPLRFQP